MLTSVLECTLDCGLLLLLSNSTKHITLRHIETQSVGKDVLVEYAVLLRFMSHTKE